MKARMLENCMVLEVKMIWGKNEDWAGIQSHQ